ncbi:MAG: HEAT repeat domain-containing protein [Planctomycetota bacterium]
MIARFATSLLLALGLGALALPAQPRQAGHHQDQERELLRTLGRWIDDYRHGKLDLRSKDPIPSPGRLLRAGVPRGAVGNHLVRTGELGLLLEAAVEADSEPAIRALLRLAGVGLDRFRYRARHVAPLVRTMAERALAKVRSGAARAMVLDCALGMTPVGGDDERLATRAAALRALGQLRPLGSSKALRQALEAAEASLRLAAATALGQRCDADATTPLAAALQCETDEASRIGLIRALHEVLEAHEGTLPTRAIRRSVQTVVASLGRGTWRGDLAAVELLSRFRCREAVPALIGVLERNAPSDKRRRRDVAPSGLLRTRAREVLVELTGAHHAAERPDAWRAWWEHRATPGFRLAHEPPPPDSQARAGRTTAPGGFFGVQPIGTRVVFVIDVSRSMRDPYRSTQTASIQHGAPPGKLDIAKRELRKAIDGLPADAWFNIVLFSTDAKAWRRDLVRADPMHKKAAHLFIKKLATSAATNLWGGLETALGIESWRYGDRYSSHVEEVFVLSDGAPTVGDLVDPRHILTAIGETNRFAGVRIHAVYLGARIEPATMPLGMQSPWPGGLSPKEMMRKLAQENGGEFVCPR